MPDRPHARAAAPHAVRDTLRLFVALWPDAATRGWLRGCAAAVGWPLAATLVDEARWHLTLHFLGAVPGGSLADLVPALQQPFAPFAIEFGRVTAWPHGLAVVEPSHPSPPLGTLHAALAGALRRAGRRLELRTWRPHVTLARQATGAVLPPPHAGCQWPVAGFALVASAAAGYTTLAHYPSGRLVPGRPH